jgi:type I restriction enzyme S subunit
MRYEDFKQIPVHVPPLDEQKAIAGFIDAQYRRINHLIRAKRRLIDLLNQQKQAIIHRAVSRGLDPNIRLKPSGSDWLGDVPDHWEVKPLKYWAQINRRTLPESTPPDHDFRYIDIGSVETGYLVKEPVAMQFSGAPSRARRLLSIGDTIISTVRTYLKAVYYIADEVNDLVASTGFAVLTPGAKVDPEYLSYVIQGNVFIDRVTAYSTGIAYPAISETRLGAFHLALPQSIQEQKLIVSAIRNEIATQASAIQRARAEINLLREYRTRLIADVVTGKVDVRGVELSSLDEGEAVEDLEIGEDTKTDEMTDIEEIANGDEQ